MAVGIYILCGANSHISLGKVMIIGKIDNWSAKLFIKAFFAPARLSEQPSRHDSPFPFSEH
jgi:hypothetical protein